MTAPQAGTAAPTTFDPTGPLPHGRVSLEASAGTGKTWTIAALVVRYVAEGVASLDELLVVTFTRAATAELRDRVRTRLAAAARHLRAIQAGADPTHDDVVLHHVAGGDVGLSPGELEQRARRLEDALGSIDGALISTIHGFAHQVLRSIGYVGDVEGDARLVEDVDDLTVAVGRDLLVRLYADEVDDDVLAAAPSDRKVQDLILEALRHPDARVSPEPDDPTVGEDARQLSRVATLVAQEVRAGKHRRGIMTFDDLLHRLAAALADDRVRETVRATFRSRFRVALIDEAQDTDPVQWQILEGLFADQTLVLIGDPKQAIYRFRGADVHAYVRATGRPDTTCFGLTTNHRSDGDYVRAVNALFRDTTFGDEAISHHDVAAHHTSSRLHDPGGGAALRLRIHRPPDRNARAEPTRQAIARDLAAHVRDLLGSGATIEDDETGPRPVRPGDIAVLVRSHASVEYVTAALRDVAIPHVVTSVGSVFEAPAANDWRVLLQSLARPSSTTRLRSLARSAFVGRSAGDVANLTEDDLDALATMVHGWTRVLRDDGVASLLRTVHAQADMGARLLAITGGERTLTDVEHIGELLHASEAAGQGPVAMQEWLVQQRNRQRRDDIPAEQRARRLESDSNALAIMTVHASKGLEFPIVFLPYLMWAAGKPHVPFTTTGDDPVLELGGPDVHVHQQQSCDEDEAENLRLAYVAFTRARHRTVAWWWPSQSPTKRPITKLVLRRKATPEVSATSLAGKVAGGGMEAALDDLADRTAGSVDWAWMDPDPPRTPLPASAEPVPQLDAAVFGRDIDRTWTRTSYSALTTPLARLARASESDGPTADGITLRDDEPDLGTAPEPDTADAAGLATAPALPLPLPLGAMYGGARIGTLVHELYEHVDFAADDVADQLRGRLDAMLGDGAEATLGMPVDQVVDAIVATLDTPLGPAFSDLALRSLTRQDRRDEVAFELPVAVDGSGRQGLGLGAIREVFQSLPADDPMAGYADRLDDPALARTVRGHLTGFIDLVARRQVGQDQVFHVVDYKTNVRYRRDDTPTTAAYDQPSLVAAMHDGHYPLQAALYAVALHRLLRWRLPGYDPDVNLGAIGYLFVRGMVGPHTPMDDAGNVAGVMAWRPPAAFVTALSDCLHTGKATP